MMKNQMCHKKRLGKIFILSMGIGLLSGCSSKNEISIELAEHIKEPIVIQYGEEIPTDIFVIGKIKNDTNDPVTLTQKNFTYPKDEVGEHELVVKVGSEEKIFDLKIEAAPLKTPYLDSEPNLVKWEQVEHADHYTVYVNKFPYENIKNEKFHLEDVSDSALQYEIQVVAYAEEGEMKYTESEKSEVYVMNKLETPTGIKYETGKIKWNPVKGAEKYTVQIGKSSYTVNSNEYKYDMPEVGCTVNIVAMSTDKKSLNSNAAEVCFKQLTSVSNIRYSDGRILWTSSEEDCNYIVAVDGKEEQRVEPFLEFEAELNQMYQVSVQAVPTGDDSYVLASEVTRQSIQYTRLEKPKFEIKQGTSDTEYEILISEVLNADQYKIDVIEYIGDISKLKNYETSGTTYKFVVDREATKLQIKVTAVSKSGAFADSEPVQSERKIEHNKLETPIPQIVSGEYKNVYYIEYQKVPNADKYHIIVTYTLKTDKESVMVKEYDVISNEKKINAPDNTMKIEVEVIAINESGVHEQSNSGSCARKIK